MPTLSSTAWSHLPNAALIDLMLLNLATYPDQFAVLDNSPPNAAQRDTARQQMNDGKRDRVYHCAYDAAYRAAPNGMREKAWRAVSGAMLALVTYDDAEQYLSMTAEELRLWAALSESPAAILLQPYVRACDRVAQMQQICP